MTVCDHATGDVVFAYSFDGSINDQTILPEIYLRMKFAGLDLTNELSKLIYLQRHKQALCDSIAHKDPVLGISANAVPDE